MKCIFLEIFSPLLLRSSFFLLVSELRPNHLCLFIQSFVVLLTLSLERLKCIFLLPNLLLVQFECLLQLSLKFLELLVTSENVRIMLFLDCPGSVSSKSAPDVELSDGFAIME